MEEVEGFLVAGERENMNEESSDVPRMPTRPVSEGSSGPPISEAQRLDYILQGTNLGTWEWNVPTGDVVFNQRWAAIIGYTLVYSTPAGRNSHQFR
jgi:PAS domain-containing protein